MILLHGHTLQKKAWFRAESMPLNLEERNSTATITLGPDAPEIAINDWLQDDTEPGKGIIWRIKTVRNQVEAKTRTVTLEHVIQTLKDITIFGEITPKTITGNNSASKCTARQAIAYALGQQNVWQLGDLCENPSNPYTFNGESVYSVLETVTGSLDGAQWEYDLTSLPFTVHIRKQPTGFQSEMRMRRNITTLSIQIDRTRMYTRHYPIGKNNLHISGNYLSKNENVWGRVDKVETDQSQDTQEKLRAWSQERLNRHCEPLVTVTVTGLELSQATGEALDHIVIGRNCRLPLPEYGTVMTERVTKMSWADKIKEPKKVTVTLANQVEDVASIINSQSASSSRAGRAGAKKDEEDHAWFVDTTDHVAMVAEAIAGEGASQNWSRVSEVLVDGQGIHQRVTKAEGEIVAQEAKIDVNERRILQEVTDRTNADTTLSGRITTEAGRITAEVTRATGAEQTLSGRLTITENAITQEVTDRTNADTTLSGRITTEAGKITQIVQAVGADGEVTAASIVLAINSAGESVAHIDAGKVYIGNSKSTTVIAGKCSLSDVTAAVIQSRVGDIAQFQVNGILVTGNMTFGPTSGGFSIAASKATFSNTAGTTVSTITPKDFLKAVQIVSSGSGYKLQFKEAFDSEWQDAGTFNRAVSLSGGWNSGVYSVSATAGSISGSAPTTTLFDLGLGSPSKGTGSVVQATYDIGYAAIVNGQQVRGGSTGKTGTLNLDVSSLLQSKTFNSNGSKSPDDGYLGFSSVTVSIVPTLSGSWSNGVYSVTSSPAASAAKTTTLHDLGLGTVSRSGKNVQASYDIGYAAIVNGQQVRGGSTGKTGTITLNASSVYDYGWQSYYDNTSNWSKPTGNGDVKIPKRDGSGSETWFTISDVHSTRYTLRCTSVEQTYPGSVNNYYYFRLEGQHSFNANTNYYFYR